MDNAFGKNLKRIRTDNGLTQGELASKVNVKQGTISSWESGRTEPSMGDISRLSLALDCSQEELIGITKTAGNITFEDMIAKVQTLQPSQLKSLIEIANSQYKIQMEIIELEKAREDQERRLIEYTKRINELMEKKNENRTKK